MLPLLFVPASRQKPHQVQQTLYPSAITGGPVTACRCPLNRTFALRLSRLNRFSNASPKPSSICACTSLSVSELLHKVNLYHSLCRRSMTSTASQPASKKSSGDFPVVRCTHVLSSSMSFPYGKIVTHFRWFVNGEILIYGYFTLHSFGSGFHGDHCSSFCFCGDLSDGCYRCRCFLNPFCKAVIRCRNFFLLTKNLFASAAKYLRISCLFTDCAFL